MKRAQNSENSACLLDGIKSRGNFKFVLKLDGRINEANTLAAEGRSIKNLTK